MYKYAFERLEVWQDARAFVVFIYKITSSFPADERFGLVNQIRRAAVTIASNIAEGSGRQTIKDQQYFYRVSYSSCLEVLNQLIIASDMEFLTFENLKEARQQIEKISNKLNSLRKSIVKQ
jgi:four helix bundle protein